MRLLFAPILAMSFLLAAAGAAADERDYLSDEDRYSAPPSALLQIVE